MNLPSSSRSSLWAWIAFSAAAALLVDLGDFHRWHNSDSVIPVLASTLKWTPFFWEQNRFGMLLPLLAAPIRSPFANLLFQSWCVLFAAFQVCPLLLAYLRWPHPLAAGVFGVFAFCAAGNLGFVGALADPSQVYPLGLCLLLAALVVHDRAQTRAGQVVALPLLALAFYVNMASALFGIPVALSRMLGQRPLDSRSRARVGTQLGALAGMSLLYWGLSRLLPDSGSTTMGLAKPATWASAWWTLVSNASAMLAGSPGLLAMVAFAVALAVATSLSVNSALAASAATVMGRCLLVALAYSLSISVLKWPSENGFNGRYLIPSLWALLAGIACWCSCARASRRMALVAAAGAVSLAGAVVRSSGTSPAHAKAALRESLGQYSEDVLALGCTHVSGDYWDVWTTVFETNALLDDAGRSERVLGISFRSRPFGRSPEFFPREPRICELGAPERSQEWLERYGFLPLTTVTTRGAVTLVRPMRVPLAPP